MALLFEGHKRSESESSSAAKSFSSWLASIAEQKLLGRVLDLSSDW
jgi:hypothetical protein